MENGKQTKLEALTLGVMMGCLLVFGACATPIQLRHGQRIEQIPPESTVVPHSSTGEEALGSVYGPPEPALNVTAPIYGPAPEQKRVIVLAFGPGMVRGFASAGILKAIHSSKLEVGHIVATEMSALIAALYATSSSLNQFEWSLMRVNDELFLEPPSFLGRLTAGTRPENKLEAFLEKVFQQKTFKDLKIPFSVVTQNVQTHETIVIQEGRLVDALRATLSVPGVLPPYRVRLGGDVLMLESGRHAASSLLDQASGHPHDLILNVLLTGQAPQVSKGSGHGTLIEIKPNLHGIQDLDFTKKNEAIFRGKSVIDQEITHLQTLSVGERNREYFQEQH